MSIERGNYQKFIDIASNLGRSDEGLEVFTFDLETIAKIVDVAYNEGRIAELTLDEEYVNDSEKIERYTVFNRQIEHALEGVAAE